MGQEHCFCVFTYHIFETLGLDNLDHLTLNQNLLDHLGKGFFTGLPRLTTLYIDSNKIKSIHHEAFSGLEGKSYLFLKRKKGQLSLIFKTIYIDPEILRW